MYLHVYFFLNVLDHTAWCIFQHTVFHVYRSDLLSESEFCSKTIEIQMLYYHCRDLQRASPCE